jgi:hypothetical protein
MYLNARARICLEENREEIILTVPTQGVKRNAEVPNIKQNLYEQPIATLGNMDVKQANWNEVAQDVV